MPRHVADLHCDLLCYLEADATRTPYQEESHCSVTQMRAGNVCLQTMAIFTETGRGSATQGLEQAEIFKLLPGRYPSDYQIVQSPAQLSHLLDSDRIGILAAIENASSFCEEEGPFEEGLEHLRTIFGKVGRPLYIGLTWNTENRFGGGCHSSVGLKEDGRHLLEFLHEKQIAIDLSHASDQLIEDVFAYMDTKQLQLSVLASHANVRSVTNVVRNLSDDVIREIVRRGGVIGMNFVRPFLGTEPQKGLVAHLEALLKLVGEDHICLGADFFCDCDSSKLPYGAEGFFFPEYQDSSCYGKVMDLWGTRLGLSEARLAKVAYSNLFRWINHLWQVAFANSEVS